MVRRPVLALAVGLLPLVCGTARAQPHHVKKVSPALAEVRFGDGSLVRMTVLQDAVEVQTKYGKLAIPVTDIRRIDFGRHVPEAVDTQIAQSIKLLASDLYKEREGASRDLIQVGHWAYPHLQRAARSGDLEVANRAAGVMRQIADRCPPDLLRLKEDDVVQTADFPVVGRIVSPTLKAYSSHFGEMALRLSDLRTLHLRHHGGNADLTVDATKHGSSLDGWLDTGIAVDPTQRLVIHGDGQVDLWPMGPGQYLASPKGFNTPGKGGTFLAGALVGRVGETGKAFLIGERYEGTPAEEGKLYLQIIPSPWNNASAGAYRVRVNTDHIALTER